MDKLLALKMFVETVDAKGFSAAARQLGVATSSVTRMIDSLESELGTVLFNRSTRQVTVSDAGAAYYQRARKILDDVADADATVTDTDEEPSGPLRISVPTAFGRRIIAPRLGMLMARHPRLELDITLTDNIVDLFAERVDLSIRLGAAAPMDGVVSRTLGEFRRRVIASQAYLTDRGEPLKPADLASHDCLRFNFGSPQQSWNFLSIEGEVRVPVSGRFKSNNAEVLREMAKAGGGIALLPDWLIDEDIADGALIELFEHSPAYPDNAVGQISALYLPNHRGSRRVKAFIGFMHEILAR
ncbi:LysR family transcriptional regulator [Pseudomonas sp. efr-133-TYG-103a]|uniref:LysR family transcriptional regulator n=1 Tax=Pseudomonas sp. efr-133-TYG-103a TaxID=3040308 RepID=UPI002553085D|nr:LysR family transcriptional regulator [Pseudomonas sp. efr-133-TYG-103a]